MAIFCWFVILNVMNGTMSSSTTLHHPGHPHDNISEILSPHNDDTEQDGNISLLPDTLLQSYLIRQQGLTIINAAVWTKKCLIQLQAMSVVVM